MKVASWETFVVGNPPPHEGGNYFIFYANNDVNNFVVFNYCKYSI